MKFANKKYTLSAIVITKNEEDRIERCLSSIQNICDEIIVLDSQSADKTVELCKKFTEKVYKTDWPGYGIQKQRALEKATGDWVISLDADEEVSSSLEEEIHHVLNEGPQEKGFCLRWAVVSMGKTLRFAQGSRAPLRLFRREGAVFTPDSVHEVVKVPGKIVTLKGKLYHYTHRNLGHALEKNAKYAWLSAQEKFKKGKKGDGLLGALIRGWLKFIQNYIFRGGFLDGRPGFLYALMHSHATFYKYAALWSLWQEQKNKK